MDHTDRHDRSPAVAELLDDAYVSSVDVETAARHLWMIHKEADRLRNLAVEQGPGQPSEVVPDTIESLSLRRTVPRAAVPLLVAVMMMSSSGMALAASQSSLPGDILYPVKRGTESAQLVFARDPDTRAQLQLAFARTRLDEIRRIGTSRPQHVAELVSDISVSLAEVEQSAPASAPASQRIREETTEQIASLSLPGTVTQAVDQAMTTPAPTVATTPTDVADERTASPSATPTSTTTAPASPSTGPSATPSVTATEPVIAGADATATEGAGTPGVQPSTDGSEAPGSADPTATEGSASPSPSPTPSESEQPATPVVTPRPHPSGEGSGGTSRTESEDPSDPGEESTPASEDPSSTEPVETFMPFTRPQD